MEISAGDVFNGFVWLNLDFFWGHFEFNDSSILFM